MCFSQTCKRLTTSDCSVSPESSDKKKYPSTAAMPKAIYVPLCLCGLHPSGNLVLIGPLIGVMCSHQSLLRLIGPCSTASWVVPPATPVASVGISSVWYESNRVHRALVSVRAWCLMGLIMLLPSTLNIQETPFSPSSS